MGRGGLILTEYMHEQSTNHISPKIGLDVIQIKSSTAQDVFYCTAGVVVHSCECLFTNIILCPWVIPGLPPHPALVSERQCLLCIVSNALLGQDSP